MANISRFKGPSLRLMALILLAAVVLPGEMGAGSISQMGGVIGGEGKTTAKGMAEAIAAGVWIAPEGLDEISQDREETLQRLSGPSRILKIMVQEEDVAELGYIGTYDGVLVLWPDVTETLRLIAPFDHRERPWYLEASRAKDTIWTKPYLSQSSGLLAITCATPIVAGSNLTGVVGMDVSLAEIDSDLSNISIGYPFLLDGQGVVVIRPPVPEGFLWEEILTPGSLLDSRNPELAGLAEAMVRGERGAAYLRLGIGSTRISYAPLPSVGWSLALTSGDIDLVAAKASQYDQLFRRISGQTEVLALETGMALEGSGRWMMMPPSGPLSVDGDAAGLASILLYALGIAIASALLAGAIGFRRGRKVVAPMVEAVKGALERVGDGDLTSRIEVGGSKGMRALGEAFDKMTSDLKDQISLVERGSFEAGRSEKEGEISDEVGRFLQPDRIPQLEGYQVAALSLAEGHRCCHFYDVFEAEGSKAVVVISEVSGKGLSAAMVAALTRSLTRAGVRRFGDPAKALRETNLHLSDNLRNGIMVSCFCGILDLSNHSMNYANAGHIPPFVVSSDGFVDTLVGGAISMGALDHIDLDVEGWMIDPGDVLVIYNDGLMEIENEKKERFGTERVISLVKDNKERSAQDIMKELEKAIAEHLGGRPLRSDPAVLIVKRSV
jgi:sigma-B regulation protein RsbU (phosphoserine phosphatase)